jgi:WhiB family redox-sensing transcriptional regulator
MMSSLPPRPEVLEMLTLIVEARNERDWRDLAACKGMDPDVFFLKRDQGGRNGAAKAICAGCPVSAECLEVGANELSGIWGGLSARQRRQLGHSKTDFRMIYREWIRLTDPSQEMAAHDLGVSPVSIRSYRQRAARK